MEKFRRNQARDRSVTRELRARGWRVFVIWECSTMNQEALQRRVAAIVRRIGKTP